MRLCDCVCEVVSGCSVWGRRVGCFVMSPDVSSGRARWPGARACSAPRCSCPPVLSCCVARRTSPGDLGFGEPPVAGLERIQDWALGYKLGYKLGHTSCGAAIPMTVVTRDEKSNCGSGRRPAQLEPGWTPKWRSRSPVSQVTAESSYRLELVLDPSLCLARGA